MENISCIDNFTTSYNFNNTIVFHNLSVNSQDIQSGQINQASFENKNSRTFSNQKLQKQFILDDVKQKVKQTQNGLILCLEICQGEMVTTFENHFEFYMPSQLDNLRQIQERKKEQQKIDIDKFEPKTLQNQGGRYLGKVRAQQQHIETINSTEMIQEFKRTNPTNQSLQIEINELESQNQYGQTIQQCNDLIINNSNIDNKNSDYFLNIKHSCLKLQNKTNFQHLSANKLQNEQIAISPLQGSQNIGNQTAEQTNSNSYNYEKFQNTNFCGKQNQESNNNLNQNKEKEYKQYQFQKIFNSQITQINSKIQQIKVNKNQSSFNNGSDTYLSQYSTEIDSSSMEEVQNIPSENNQSVQEGEKLEVLNNQSVNINQIFQIKQNQSLKVDSNNEKQQYQNQKVEQQQEEDDEEQQQNFEYDIEVKKQAGLGENQSSKRKNVIKNIVKAFRRFILDNNKVEGIIQFLGLSDADDREKKVKDIRKSIMRLEQKKKYNYQMIISILHSKILNSIFKYFIDYHSDDWLRESKIQNQNILKEVIMEYQAMFSQVI